MIAHDPVASGVAKLKPLLRACHQLRDRLQCLISALATDNRWRFRVGVLMIEIGDDRFTTGHSFQLRPSETANFELPNYDISTLDHRWHIVIRQSGKKSHPTRF